MANELPALPANILTTKRYEEQQAKLLAKDSELDRDAFLKLFTTQLKNQNPLDPMENEAFVAQLAQFSSLEAIQYFLKIFAYARDYAHASYYYTFH